VQQADHLGDDLTDYTYTVLKAHGVCSAVCFAFSGHLRGEDGRTREFSEKNPTNGNAG
jgi:hypothetical protein